MSRKKNNITHLDFVIAFVLYLIYKLDVCFRWHHKHLGFDIAVVLYIIYKL
jgi:hypothetical protein